MRWMMIIMLIAWLPGCAWSASEVLQQPAEAGQASQPSSNPSPGQNPNSNAANSSPTTNPTNQLNPNNHPNPDTPVSSDTSTSRQITADDVRAKADTIVAALQKKDMKTIAQASDPKAGIRFSAYGHIDVKKDITMLPTAKFADIMGDSTEYDWGVYDGSGQPIHLTFKDYYSKFIYDQDFAKAKDVSVNQIIGKNTLVNNQFDVYPRDQFMTVEYHFPGFDPKVEGHDWRSLRLVFAVSGTNGNITLRAIIHDQWTT
ncbi:MAG: hypothetical protein K0R75_2468 [Paenibacillaceae bacterium]|jgi:hypothetical protein|nr:hypothetical protein [Paenibacillaceae bacterium]